MMINDFFKLINYYKCNFQTKHLKKVISIDKISQAVLISINQY